MNSQPGFQPCPWISENSGIFHPTCSFYNPNSGLLIHPSPGLLGTHFSQDADMDWEFWEYPTPKAALVTSHKFFPKEKDGKKRDSPCFPWESAAWAYLDIPTSHSRIWRGISSGPLGSHAECPKPVSFPISRPVPIRVTSQRFPGSSIPFPDPTEAVPDPSHSVTFPEAASLECLVTPRAVPHPRDGRGLELSAPKSHRFPVWNCPLCSVSPNPAGSRASGSLQGHNLGLGMGERDQLRGITGWEERWNRDLPFPDSTGSLSLFPAPSDPKGW